MVNLLSRLLLFLLSLHCFVACLAASSKNITTDQYALLAFKSLITSDPYDMLTNNWSTSSSVCNWVGVTCDERHGRVHSLILRNMSLRGTVSPNLGNLSFLVILDLKNNSFGGHFPKELCGLRRLKVLKIGKNKLSGLIPQTVSNMSSLEYIDLSSNYFSGPMPGGILNMPRLQQLYLSGNNMEGKIPSVYNMTSLRVVKFGYNNLNGSLPNDFFIRLPQLENFTLDNNQFEGSIPRSIGNCTSLISLDLSSNFFTGLQVSKRCSRRSSGRRWMECRCSSRTSSGG